MRTLTIYGYPLNENFDYSKLFPWSDDIVATIDNKAILIGDIMVLWCVSRKLKPFPKYLKKNYVESVHASIKKLTECGLIFNDDISDKGLKLLRTNNKLIELHRNGWFTKKDEENNRSFNKEKDQKYIDQLKSFGDFNRIEEFKKRKEKEHLLGGLSRIFEYSERLSKDGDLIESNKVAIKLLKTEYSNDSELYWRLAINYRKLKDYQSEIDIIERALNKEKMSWSFHNKQQFENRLNKAKLLLEKK